MLVFLEELLRLVGLLLALKAQRPTALPESLPEAQRLVEPALLEPLLAAQRLQSNQPLSVAALRLVRLLEQGWALVQQRVPQ